ncbi:MAG TPA: twin-arginine translocation signal domain-containing protein, partial [Chryseosolibacter sp.]
MVETENEEKVKTSRRNFLSKTALGVGGAGFLNSSVNAGGFDPAAVPAEKSKRLPREVWVAALTQYHLKGNTVKELIANTVKAMESVACYTPD